MRFIRNKNVCDLEDVRRYLREGQLDMYERYGFGLYRVQQRERDARRHVRVDQADTLPDADVGYAFLPEFRSKGYADDDHDHRVFRPNRILAIVSPDNVSSIRILRESGIEFEKRGVQAGIR